MDNLKFRVSPHIVEDLGVNLYTTLGRVLVEFVANAHDADATKVRIKFNWNAIEDGRNLVKATFDADKAAKKNPLIPLAHRTLDPSITIVIEDDGDGMSRPDLQEKFLVVGRRRRVSEATARTSGNRIVMGRKGLGKLAGFGVAHQVDIVSRRKGESHATKITLDYDALVTNRSTEEVVVPTQQLDDGGGIEKKGTRIILSKIVYDSAKGTAASVIEALMDHFSLIKPEQFAIYLGDSVDPAKAQPPAYNFAYPIEPSDRSTLVEAAYAAEGQNIEYQYRLRFTEKPLLAERRGIRVYAHNRLAASPDLFGVNTGTHGFQYLSYLDGVIVADFIDDQPIDYISTDRQSLRWETPLLAPLREFMRTQIIDALNERAKEGNTRAETKVKQDPFTQKVIDDANLPAHRKKTAFEIASALAQSKAENLNDAAYKRTLPLLVKGLGHGELLTAISKLANEDLPDFQQLVKKITSLTAREFDEFMEYVHGRIDGIAGLTKLYDQADFRKKKNETQLHDLLEKNPWLINATFTQFLTSDVTEDTMREKLAKHLEIGVHKPKGYKASSDDETKELGSNKRPDLVFLLGSTSLHRLIIVELKALNTPLHIEHLQQLKDYMRRAEDWLKLKQPDTTFVVEGFLIGSKGDKNSSDKIRSLDYEIKQNPNQPWKVRDISEVLEDTKCAHSALLKAYNTAAAKG